MKNKKMVLKGLIFVLITILMSFNVFSDLDTNLSLYYTMDDDDISGSIMIDLSGHNNGTLTNSPDTGVSGKLEEAVNFTKGSDDLLDPAGSLNIDGEYTLCFAFKKTDVGDGVYEQGYRFDSSGAGYIRWLEIGSTNIFNIILKDDSANECKYELSNSGYVDNDWHFACLVANESTGVCTKDLYVIIDGTVTSPSVTDGASAMNSFTTPTGVIGNHPTSTSRGFGNIDNFLFYDIELEKDNLDLLYNSGDLCNPIDNPTGCAGGGSEDSVSVALDINFTNTDSIWFNWSVVGNYSNSTIDYNCSDNDNGQTIQSEKYHNYTTFTNNTLCEFVITVKGDDAVSNSTDTFFITTDQSTPVNHIPNASLNSIVNNTETSLTPTINLTLNDGNADIMDLTLYRRISDSAENFSLFLLEDTQNYVDQGDTTQLNNIGDWIVNNWNGTTIGEGFNIPAFKVVLALGDLTQDNVEAEWEIINNSIYKTLDLANIPYAVTFGDHDWDSGSAKHTFIDEYFPCSRFSSMSIFGGCWNSTSALNSYHFFNASNNEFMISALRSQANGQVPYMVEWINETMKNNTDKRVILLVHNPVKDDGTTFPNNPPPAIWDVTIENFETAVWDKIKNNPNLDFIWGGHRVEHHNHRNDTINGNKIWSAYWNIQDQADDGKGNTWNTILAFYPNEDRIETWIFQTKNDSSYITGVNYHYNHTYDMDGTNDIIIQTNTSIADETDVIYTFSGLDYSTSYEWYYVLNDSLNSVTSGIYSFTTESDSSNKDFLTVTLDKNFSNNESNWFNFSTLGNFSYVGIFNGGTLIYNGSNKYYNHTGLSNNTEYSYNVSVNWNSTIFNETNFVLTTLQTIPIDYLIVSLSSWSSNNNSNYFTWSTSGSYSYFEVYNLTTLLYNGSSKSYNHTSLLNNTGYLYNVSVFFNTSIFNSTTFTLNTTQTGVEDSDDGGSSGSSSSTTVEDGDDGFDDDLIASEKIKRIIIITSIFLVFIGILSLSMFKK
ncbi:hypothetical protein K8R33_02935 [archaeon]|nr:hypothetical protein [archaeon]